MPNPDPERFARLVIDRLSALTVELYQLRLLLISGAFPNSEAREAHLAKMEQEALETTKSLASKLCDHIGLKPESEPAPAPPKRPRRKT